MTLPQRHVPIAVLAPHGQSELALYESAKTVNEFPYPIARQLVERRFQPLLKMLKVSWRLFAVQPFVLHILPYLHVTHQCLQIERQSVARRAFEERGQKMIF